MTEKKQIDYLQSTDWFANLRAEIKCLLYLDKSNLLTAGLNNWKLRLVLSALLCIFGLGALVSMSIDLFVPLSVYNKTLVSIAIFIVGVPAYLIISNLANIDERIVVTFLNANLEKVEGKAEVLLKKEDELDETEKAKLDELLTFFDETPLHRYLPAKPVKQAYFIFLFSVISSFAIWYIG